MTDDNKPSNLEKYLNDLCLYGQTFYVMREDGTVEHLPLLSVRLEKQAAIAPPPPTHPLPETKDTEPR